MFINWWAGRTSATSSDAGSPSSSTVPVSYGSVYVAVAVACCGAFSFGYHLGVLNGPLQQIAIDLGIAANTGLQGLVRDMLVFLIRVLITLLKPLLLTCCWVADVSVVIVSGQGRVDLYYQALLFVQYLRKLFFLAEDIFITWLTLFCNSCIHRRVSTHMSIMR